MARLAPARIEAFLARDDKVSLGGGGRVVWAPEFPRHASVPGFWDHACYLEHRVEPLFTVTFLDETGRALALQPAGRRWVPGRLEVSYRRAGSWRLREERICHRDVLVSRLVLRNEGRRARRARALVWTVQRRDEVVGGPEERDGRISWTVARPGLFDGPPERIGLSLGTDRPPRSHALYASEASFDLPDWRLTPFHERLGPQGLDNAALRVPEPWSAARDLRLYLGLEVVLEVDAGGEACLTAGLALAPSPEEAGRLLAGALGQDPLEAEGRAFQDWWAAVPSFRCSDPYLERAYWYRWFGLRLNSVAPSPQHGLPFPCVFEGTNAGWFRHAIAYSAQAHMRELRWMKDPGLARGSLRNFIVHQRPDGTFPGYLSTAPGFARPSFYHASWGTAVLGLHRVHPDRAFLEECYRPLVRYARYFQQERDPEGWHLYDVLDHWETGQEYAGRYLAADPAADRGGRLRLKGLDATCYVYELYRALAWMAGALGQPGQARQWQAEARATARAVRERLWDPALEFFTDLDPDSGRRTGVVAAVGFYPFMSDLATRQHLAALHRHLFDPGQFWTPYPVPSATLSDAMASPHGDWRGVRAGCPWNGRSWLMTNSHVCQGLARAARTLDPGLRPQAAELVRRCLQELFLDGRLDRPSSYEYYNPLTGQAPYFRGTDDYMHSWVADLIIQQVAGLQPDLDQGLQVDPLPFGLPWFALEDAWVKGRRVDVRWEAGRGLVVDVDGRTAARRDDLGPVGVSLGD